MRSRLGGCLVVLLVGFALWAVGAAAEDQRIRVLVVGGDWKSQLPGQRGDFVRREVEKAAPGKFAFTLWTTYEFLQYGDAESLRAFDVVAVGDLKGQSVVPRLMDGLTRFVEGGGGFLYLDNHKAFTFPTRELSFDPVLPIEVVPYRPYGGGDSQPYCTEQPLTVRVCTTNHPVVQGLDFSAAPALRGARTGKVKPGATIVAASPAGVPLWVAWDKGNGRALWLGGVLANDELSEDFAKWPAFGKFYAQALGWLAGKSIAPRVTLRDAVATATVTVDSHATGSVVSARHFSMVDYAGYPMVGSDLALYEALHLDRAFVKVPCNVHGPDDSHEAFDFTRGDMAKYDCKGVDDRLAELTQLRAEPIFTEDPGFDSTNWMARKSALAARLVHVNGLPGGPQPVLCVRYIEVLNDPHHHTGYTAEVLNRYFDRFNDYASDLRKLQPVLRFGAGAFQSEWPYVQQMIDRCGTNLGWVSRAPSGYTGEAIFRLQDEYAKYARSKGVNDLQFLLSECDFWLYGAPSFDYLMMRFKPTLDHADSCIGVLQYTWHEYEQGGYVYGLVGRTDGVYGQVPPEWPNPGKDKPVTYRYNAFRIMRDCRGAQCRTTLASPELATSPSPRAYAVATCNEGVFNIVLHYGYAWTDLAQGRTFRSLKVHVTAPIPAAIRGRTLTITRADCRNVKEEPSQTVAGDAIDLDVEFPAQSAVALTLK